MVTGLLDAPPEPDSGEIFLDLTSHMFVAKVAYKQLYKKLLIRL
jgi:hypothetical protein